MLQGEIYLFNEEGGSSTTLLHTCPFRILTGAPTTQVEVSRGYPQFLKANAEMFGPIRPNGFLPYPLHHSLNILSLDAANSVLLTVLSLNHKEDRHTQI